MQQFRFRVGPTSIAAGGSDLTSLEGRNGRFIASPTAAVRIKATCSAAGLEAECRIGQREVTQRGTIPVEPAAGSGPNLDTPYFASAPGQLGEEVFMRLYNPTVGALTYTYDFEQTPV
jgi:hypothetical protein